MRNKQNPSPGAVAETDQTRQRIMDAARTLMARQGFSATTMQQIVAEAETSIGNAYFYFDNKQHLLDEIVSVVAETQWRAIDRYLDTLQSREEQLAAGLFLNNFPPVAGAVPELGLQSGEPDHPVLDAFQRRMRQHYLVRLQEYLPNVSADRRAFIIDFWIGAGRNIALANASGELGGSPQESVRELVIFSLRGIGFDENQIDLAQQAVDDILRIGLGNIFQQKAGS